ncbi:MAG: MjaI family restriction endonuclease [Planctomycetota bacterium]
MAKEWIINQANMRWGLTRKKQVGPVAELIRKCAPKTVEEWESYYYQNAYTKEHLEKLGQKLYIKVSEVCHAEIESVTEADCIGFVVNLVINRTFDGYQSEIQTVYGRLQHELGVPVDPAPDEWDRGYNVDFVIRVDKHFIGLQIKPAGYAYITQIIKELEFQKKTHQKFTEKLGGKVFYIISITEDKKKIIYNPEVIEEIKKEIERLKRVQDEGDK